MTEKQVLKKIEKVLELIMQKEIREAIKVLIDLKVKLEAEIKEKNEGKEHGKKLKHLMGWYLSLWNHQPPESFRFTDYKLIIGKHLRELIQIYERNGEDIETLKRDYEVFKSCRDRSNGILQFRMELPNIKGTKAKEWSSAENQRGKDYYLYYYLKDWMDGKEKKLWRADDEIPW